MNATLPTLRKLRAKWSGPWKVKKHIFENKIEIVDPKDSNVTEEVHIARIKPYRKREFYTWSNHEKLIRNGKLKDEINFEIAPEEQLVF